MEQIDLLALCRYPDVSWSFLAREAQRQTDVERLLAGEPAEDSPAARKTSQILLDAHADFAAHRAWVEDQLGRAAAEGIQLTTVLDDDYPINLRVIDNLPPFLFYRGRLELSDAFSVAVVGTRNPSAEGLIRARRMSAQLTRQGVTILSGLARGIDTAAHEACLEVGGRTIAVLGSGIRRMYPPENAGLAERIVATGAVVSQFWPDMAPAKYTFPRRNVVTSGISQGTVVIEASSTSGAKMQARLAVEHGKQVFLITSLVTAHKWAREYLGRPRVYEVTGVDEILQRLRSTEHMRSRATDRVQLALSL